MSVASNLIFSDFISFKLIFWGKFSGEAWPRREAQPMRSERSDHVTASTACRLCKVREWMAASQSVPTFLGQRTSPFLSLSRDTKLSVSRSLIGRLVNRTIQLIHLAVISSAEWKFSADVRNTNPSRVHWFLLFFFGQLNAHWLKMAPNSNFSGELQFFENLNAAKLN